MLSTRHLLGVARRFNIRSQRGPSACLCARGRSSQSTPGDDHSGVGVLPYRELPFRAVELNVEELPVNDTSEFSTRLFTTLAHLREKDMNACYLKVNMLYSHYVTAASMFGFKFHHAEGDHCSLLLWLPDDRPCAVPPFATHHVGVGAVIVNEKQELLVVKEKSKLAGWKLPGGYVNLGEELGAAAEREVWEETGVKSKFQSVLSFRHSLNMQWGRGDVYVVCKCLPLTSEIKIDSEIDDATWMHVEEYKKQTSAEMMRKIIGDLPLYGGSGGGELRESTLTSLIPGRGKFKFYSPF